MMKFGRFRNFQLPMPRRWAFSAVRTLQTYYRRERRGPLLGPFNWMT